MDYNLQKNQNAEQTYIALFQFETHCVLNLSLIHIQVQLRHTEEKEIKESNLSFREMVLNKATFQVSIGGKILPKITRQEFAILELLLRNPKQVFSKEDIFEYAWDEPYMGETKTLDVHISNIRKKIKTVTSEEYIETVWGIGYRLHL